MSVMGRKAKLMACLSLGVGLVLAGLANSQPAPVPGAADTPSSTRVYVAQTPVVLNEKLFEHAATVKQGEVLKIRVSDIAQCARLNLSAYVATLDKQKAPFFKQDDGTFLALVPVSVFQNPGVYPVSIGIPGQKTAEMFDVTVQDAHYRTQNVSVSKSTAGLKPLPGELETIQALKDTLSAVQYWKEPFISPTQDCQNSPFGVKRYHNGKPTGDYHKGVDLRSPSGRPIRAISAGKVQIARMYRLHGGTVGLDHGQGISSIYIHMSKLAVQPDEMVKKGDVIGYVGSTGFASGPHLHWGLYVSGLPVNPNQWIRNVPTCR